MNATEMPMVASYNKAANKIFSKNIHIFKMNRIAYLILIAAFSSIQALAQYGVKGSVADSTGVGEAFATIRIYNASDTGKPIKLGTTDANGIFNQGLEASGKYSINITSVGKEAINRNFEVSKTNPIFDFGELTIKEASTSLSEVTVTAQKPLVKNEIDRVSYDIQADEDSKTSTIFEMLKKVPMVTVDGQENIKVKGSSEFKIYKNGRPNSSWSSNPKEVLKSIPASMIKRIEVITEPGAKYDAEGVSGILNIITNDNSAINGVLGSASIGISNWWNPNINTYLTTQFGKLTTTINYGYNKFGSDDEISMSSSDKTAANSGTRFLENTAGIGRGYIHYGNIESSYEIDSLNLVTMSFGGYYYKMNPVTDGSTTVLDNLGQTIYSFNSRYTFPKYNYFDFNGKLDYQHLTHHKDEALTFSYLISTTNQENESRSDYTDLVNFPLPYEWQTSNSRLKFMEHTFQFDWTRPFAKKHKFETGAKYILRTNDSRTTQTFSEGDDLNTRFNHTTHVAALYGEYSFNSTHWGARAGLRYELSRLNAKYKDGSNPDFGNTLNDLVPTFSLSYKINDANNFKLNYATRISRPGIAYLNPAVTSSPTSVSQGNPDLKSARSNSVSFSYNLLKPKIMLMPSISYRYSSNLLQKVQHVDNNILYSTYDNVGKFNNLSFSTYLQWTITKTTRLMLNGSVTYSKYLNEQQNLKNTYWGWFAYTNISQELPWKIHVSLGIYHTDWGIDDVYGKSDNMWQYNVGIRRSFLKDDKLTVSAWIQNPFSSKYATYKESLIHGDMLGSTSTRYLNRRFQVSISYRFGSLKTSVKKVNKSIDNEDLQGRK